MDQKLLDLHQKLQSKECLKFLYQKLEEQIIWRKVLPKKKKLVDERVYLIDEIQGISPYDPLNHLIKNGVFIEEQFSLHSRDGVIAGGAIAAWLNEFINKVPAVINDIDYFYYDFKTTESEKVEHISYEGVGGADFDYEIVRVSQEDKVNKIKIHIGKDFTWQDLIRSFDLNCTLVAFDPFTRSLIYHREFLEFLSDRTIEPLKTWHSDAPLNTYIRAYKKSFELLAPFYMHKHMQIFLNKRNKYWWKLNQFCFKIVHRNQIASEPEPVPENEYGLINKPNVLICSRSSSKSSIFSFHNNKNTWEELISLKKYNYWKENKKILEPWISLTDDGYAVINKKDFNYPWFIFYSRLPYSDELDKFISYSPTSDVWYSGDLDFDERMEEKYPHFYEKTHCFYQQLGYFIDSTAFNLKELQFLFKQDSHNFAKDLYQEFSKKHFEQFNIFVKEHEYYKRLFNIMLNEQVFNYSLKEALLFFYTISKWSIELIGVMEAALTNLPVIDSYSIRNLDALSGSRFNARCKEIFGYVLRKDIKGMKLYLQECYNNDLDTDLLVKKLNIAPFWSKYVNELHMNSQLHAESDSMKHCVRGYGDKVKTGMSRIFHISINGHSSTLELNMIVNNREDFKKILEKKPRFEMFDHFYNLQQHKAFGNARPHDLCWKVAHRLIAYLNHYNQYEIIIKNNTENRERRDRRRQVEGRRRDELSRL